MKTSEVMTRTFNEDCMIGMARYPDKYFDLAVVDPPYGIGFEDGGKYYKRERKAVKGKNWDTSVPTPEYFTELRRVSKNQIIWGGNYFELPPTRGIIAWIKTKEIQDRTFSEFELAWSSYNLPARYIELKPFQRNGSRIHPTQKPVELYKWLLSRYASPGDRILDTHLGSGSSRIAADELGFEFTAFELDKEYFDAQELRFKQYKAQLIIPL